MTVIWLKNIKVFGKKDTEWKNKSTKEKKNGRQHC